MSFIKIIAGRRVVPVIPVGYSANTANDEAIGGSNRRDGCAGLGLFITYEDAGGMTSARRIRCSSYDPGHDTLNAWCFEREAPRQFQLERIQEAVCPETGEVFDLVKLLASLRDRGMPLDDPRLARILTVLVFLMRCDGVDSRELSVLEAAVTGFALRFDGNDETVEGGVRLAATLAPDARDFMRAINWLHWRKDGPELARFLKAQAARMLDADGHHSEAEFAIASELQPLLDRIAARHEGR